MNISGSCHVNDQSFGQCKKYPYLIKTSPRLPVNAPSINSSVLAS